jgi:hypothetical protein
MAVPPTVPAIDNFPLNNLLEVKWRGVSVPIINLTTSLTHDVVEHKFPNVDGARLEEMGRNPLVMTGTIPFFNGITPAKFETWNKGQLYPQQYTAFLLAAKDGSDGKFQHPFLGEFDAKLISHQSRLQANVRGGELVDVVWKETLTNNTSTAFNITNLQLLAASISKTVDSDIGNLLVPNPRVLFPFLFQPQPVSLSQLVAGIRGLIDGGSLAIQQVTAQITRLGYYCKSIIQSCQLANTNTLASINAATYSLMSTATILGANFHVSSGVKPNSFITQKQTKTQRQTKVFENLAYTTLTQLSAQLNNSLTDIMNLNPTLLGSPFVKPGNAVVYYIS